MLILMLAVALADWVSVRSTAHHEAGRDIDNHLRTSVAMLQITMADQRPENDLDEIDLRRAVGSDLVSSDGEPAWSRPPSFEVLAWDNSVVLRSREFPPALRAASEGFDDRLVHNESWRVLTRFSEQHGFIYRVAVSKTTIASRSRELERQFLKPLIWMLLVFVPFAILLVRQGLAPLRRLESAVARQVPDDPKSLDIERNRIPRELRGLVAQLDRLLERMRDVLIRQRAFIGAAGHELRTPLAGCRAQVQVVLRSKDRKQRDRALDNIQRAVDRMTCLVDQLLLLARNDPAAPRDALQEVDLVALVEDVVTTCRERVGHAAVTLNFASSVSRLPLPGDASLLEAMFTNLVDNAVRFSPRAAAVEIRLDAQDQEVVIRVRDHGPGIAEADRERAFDPFYRRDEHSRSNSGLGLTIVQAVAKRHGGKVELLSAQNGTQAVVTLPLAT
ncbi:sensor histidine kinase [Modicisalibacter ilicicola]|uniref:sensor histidine kinase n=1 Tax=Modicisalibacter ilicicola TaxID=480814 RepID=UPI00158771ED|nr:ATP-binding protein [Halomonas ilicicola]